MSRIINIDEIRIRSADIKSLNEPRTQRPLSKKQQQTFIMVPLEWSFKLAHPKHAYTPTVLNAILFLNWKAKGEPVTLSTVALRGWGITANEKWRALRELESLGLVTIERGWGKSPKVILMKPGARKH